MATYGYVEYPDAGAEVRAVYDDIMRTRGVDWVSNFWKAIAHDPALLRRTWETLKAIMQPGALDAFTKELVYLAVSASNQCHYCIASHTASAWRAGMTDAQFAELMAVVGMANETNRLVSGYQVEIDDRFQPRKEGWKKFASPLEVYRRYMQTSQSGRLEELRAILSDDFKGMDAGAAIHSPDALVQLLAGLRGQFGDLRFEEECVTASGEWVSASGHTAGVYKGEPVRVHGMVMLRVRQGKVVELRSCYDTAAVATHVARKDAGS